MLSRSADNLYWMSRYIERAENIARMLETSSQFLLDLGKSSRLMDNSGWRPILEVLCVDEDYDRVSAHETNVGSLEFLSFSNLNSDSIVQCISFARENARMVRDKISEEMWRELNRIHLFLNSESAQIEWEFSQHDFFNRIIRFSLLFQGLVQSTIAQNEGSLFIQLGKYLERADKTTRIIDMPALYEQKPLSVSPWPTVLKSCSARTTYLTTVGTTISKNDCINLLLFDGNFPRSLRFCLNQVDSILHQISKTPRGDFSNEAERIAGSLLAKIDFNGKSELHRFGLHDYLDQIQEQINLIGEQFFDHYILLPSSSVSAPSLPEHIAHSYQQQQ